MPYCLAIQPGVGQHGAQSIGVTLTPRLTAPHTAPSPSVAGKERKKTGAAGVGRRPGRNGEGLRRIWRISRTFDHLRRRAWRRVQGHRRKQAEAETHVRGREEPLKSCNAWVRVHRRLHDYSKPARRGGAAAGGPTHVPRHSQQNDTPATHTTCVTVVLERRGYAWAFW